MATINKLLIANRGEIAVRIIRTARKMGVRTVAVYSEVDTDSLHVSNADEAYCIGHSSLADTYLNIGKILSVAKETGCDAVHPGYGFLSENPVFVSACRENGLVFIGPDEHSMHVMGNKIQAREFVASIGVPVTRGLTGTPGHILEHAGEIGFPVLVKAAAGGGGKGMRIVRAAEELKEALESTSREAASYFADGTVYLEKYLDEPRHIEIQILGDNHGNVIHLFERECTIQRRYQKIIEEAPSPTLTPELRAKMGEAAVAIGKAIKYSCAGTIEFLVDSTMSFYFLEMNTRIQVEHPITELTTKLDIVEEQIRIASGDPLRYRQEDIKQYGHAIECRIYAEDPENNFMPSPGKMNLYHEPSGEHIRVDSGITGIPVIQSFFDPMVAKLIVWGKDRDSARVRMIEALQDYVIHGIKNNISYLLAILEHSVFIENRLSTKYCDEHSRELILAMAAGRLNIDPVVPLLSGLILSLYNPAGTRSSVWEKIGYWRNYMHLQLQVDEARYSVHMRNQEAQKLDVRLNGLDYEVTYHITPGGKLELHLNDRHYLSWLSAPEPGKALVNCAGITFEVTRLDILPPQPEFSNAEATSKSDPGNIISPMPGKVIKIAVTEGQAVQQGDLLLVVEAMKMENSIISPEDGVVDSISVSVGDLVDGSTKLVHLKK